MLSTTEAGGDTSEKDGNVSSISLCDSPLLCAVTPTQTSCRPSEGSTKLAYPIITIVVRPSGCRREAKRVNCREIASAPVHTKSRPTMSKLYGAARRCKIAMRPTTMVPTVMK